MKTDTIYKKVYNDALDLIFNLGVGTIVPSENTLSVQFGVSRTTIRKVLQALGDNGVIAWDGGRRKVCGNFENVIRFPSEETIPMSVQVEARFMQWMLRDDAQPGTSINELELARQFGVATTIIREFLNRFQRYGLIEKRQNAGWFFKGFTPNFALELFEIRELFELRSARLFVSLPQNAAIWRQIRLLRQAHLDLLADIDNRYRDFSELDSQFHRAISSVSPNRFIDGFHDIIAVIFHYHYQWSKKDERLRNEVAIIEHLTFIDALLSRNVGLIELACRTHLRSARETLLRSLVH